MKSIQLSKVIKSGEKNSVRAERVPMIITCYVNSFILAKLVIRKRLCLFKNLENVPTCSRDIMFLVMLIRIVMNIASEIMNSAFRFSSLSSHVVIQLSISFAC